jgi:pre-mRNA-splicing factor ATP-dependent RNA helicase DHX16
MSSLPTRWVQDQLHTILGYSDKNVADFIIALAQKKKKVSSLVEGLEQMDVPVNDTTRAFCKELLGRMSSSAGGNSSSKAKASAREQHAAALRAKAANESYAMVGDDAEEEEKRLDDLERKRAKEREKDEAKKLKKRKREETKAEKAALKEKERLADIQARDEYAQRVLEREQEKTRQLAESKLTDEEKRRRDTEAMGDDEQVEYIPQLREHSRQEYLKKREAQQLAIMEKVVEDEKFLFGDEKLSAAERRRNKINETVLNLAKERIQDVKDVSR